MLNYIAGDCQLELFQITDKIIKAQYTEDFAYILGDSSDFISLDYNVLQNQFGDFFVKCMKTYFNGRIQIYYLLDNKRKLIDLIPRMNEEMFMHSISNIIYIILEIKKNGFLKCQHIDLSIDNIYIDLNKKNISVVYMPFIRGDEVDVVTFEEKLKRIIYEMIEKSTLKSSSSVMELAYNIDLPTMTLEDLYITLERYQKGSMSLDYSNDVGLSSAYKKYTSLCAVGNNIPSEYMPFEISICKDEVVIGSDKRLADAVIDFNRAVSHTHCKLNRHKNRYTITDLNSRNGTYINNIKIQSNQPYPIKNSDIIKLANVEFEFIVK